MSALLSPATIGIGGWALAKILLYAMRQVLMIEGFRAALILQGFATAVYGSLCALTQDDAKRLLAYSSISQMGYMLMGIANNSEAGVVGVALLYLGHGLAKASLFLSSGAIEHELETRKISQMRGLAKMTSLLAISALMYFLCLAGVPPTVGFWAELCIFTGVISSVLGATSVALVCTTVALIVTCALTTSYSVWTFKRLFLGKPGKKRIKRKKITA